MTETLIRPARQNPFAAAPTSQERHRRLVVGSITAIYALLIFEGVLRKWVFPQWGRPLFFIRDPFVLWVYALVFTKRTKLAGSAFFEIGCAFGIAGVVLLFAHGFSGGGPSPILAAYGWRNYFLYLPLPFVIVRYFHKRDIDRIVRGTLAAAIPMTWLAVIQVTAGASGSNQCRLRQ